MGRENVLGSPPPKSWGWWSRIPLDGDRGREGLMRAHSLVTATWSELNYEGTSITAQYGLQRLPPGEESHLGGEGSN